MVNIYLFVELIRAASAPDVADRIKGMSLANCKFANVVVLSYDKLVAQLDCSTPEDGTKVVLEALPKVEGVVQNQRHRRGEACAAVTGIQERARLNFPLSP